MGESVVDLREGWTMLDVLELRSWNGDAGMDGVMASFLVL